MRPRLATKFLWTVLAIVGLSIVSSLVALYGTWRVAKRLEETAEENLPAVRAEEVQIMLSERDVLLAAHLLDKGNSVWLDRLHEIKPRFQNWLNGVKTTTYVPDEEQILLTQLERAWTDLDMQQEELVKVARTSEDEAKRRLLADWTAGASKQVNNVCEKLIAANNRYVKSLMARAESRVRKTTWIVGVSSVLSLALGATLLWLFYYRVLFPLRGMVADARLFRGDEISTKNAGDDELRIMGNYLRNLMSDVSDTHSRLEQSRERLLAAEKLASVGKLAASVAHEIRNPLTAIKMWLFSIHEAAPPSDSLDRKLSIVSEEITRLEDIVRSFLEFSRPPVLNCRPQCVEPIIEQALELLDPYLRRGGIHLRRHMTSKLPPIMADPAQFKQVLLNLVTNAFDAMPEGGDISIAAAEEKAVDGSTMVVVRIADSGRGIPPDVQRRIFEPFFTTKEFGTGLGLCIAAQVMAGHGGALVLESSTEKGTCFAVWVPIAEEPINGQDSRS